MFDRITFGAGSMSGRARICGMRITVSPVVNLVANGMYLDLEAADVQQALQYVPALA